MKNSTFIIPLRIESEDRMRNIITVLFFLLENFNAKILIKEVDKKSIFRENVLPQLEEHFGDLGNLTHIFEESEDPVFYRMHILNEMLSQSKTDVVINYDCDVLLPIDSYVNAYESIIKGEYDLVYPFGVGNYQKQIFADDELVSEFLSNDFDFSILEKKSNILTSDFGWVQFFNRQVYIDGGMENENFRGSSPEDKERFFRFTTLGYRVNRIDNYIYHLEHSRGANSWPNSAQGNPYMKENFAVWEKIEKMNKEELKKYYSTQEYLNKYNNKIIVSLATPGIGNRLKTYISCMVRYDKVKTCKEYDTFIFQNLELATQKDTQKYPTIDGWRLLVDPEEEDYIDTYKTIDLLFENTPDYFKNKYQKVFNKLKINPDIEKKVNEFTEDWNNVIGVHIRSWYCARRNWHSNELFENEIDKCNPESKIFLCTDNCDIANYFNSKYANRIIQYPQNLYNIPHMAESGHNNSLDANISAFVDMYILSKCSKIIGTYGSSFTECSWWLSGCQAEMIVPKPNNIPQDFINNVFVLK